MPHAHESNEESRPLLDVENQNARVPTQLPVRQLVAMCAIRLADPIAFTQIFPYVNEMMESFGVATNPSQTGFYSGVVESIFALSQLLSIYHWASLSDKIGRRPVILASAVGISIASLCLGFSTTFSGVLLARCFAGLFSGTVAVMHSVLAEITNSSNQALAYPIFGLCWPLGVIIGPLIGGSLSNPATKYSFFSNWSLFIVFPYLLPCLAVAGMTLVAVLFGYLTLKETLPVKCRTLKQDYSVSYGAVEHDDGRLFESEKPKPSAMSLLRQPVIRALCTSGCAMSFVGTAFDVVFVLFCYSPISTGGLAFSVSQIGFALSLAGISSALIQIFLMPILLRTFTCATLYKTCMAIWPFTFLALPVLNHIAQLGCDQRVANAETCDELPANVALVVWIGIGLVLAASRVGCLAFSFNMILVKEHSPGAMSLGVANGLAQVAQCLARAVAPTFVSCLFALSVGSSLLGGHSWAIIMALFSIFSWMLSVSVPDAEKD